MRQYSRYMNQWQATNLAGRRKWFSTEAEAITHEATGGPMTEYRGFQVSPTWQIFRDGQQVFTAWWQRNGSMEEAQKMIDNSLDHHPVLSAALDMSDGPCELENGTQAREDAERWVEAQAGGLLL